MTKCEFFTENDRITGFSVSGHSGYAESGSDMWLVGDVMFYGSGAGKLPTASAVVSDVVDATKHDGINIMQLWSSKKLELADTGSLKNQFFVRVKECNREKAEKLFGFLETAKLGDKPEEFAFVTDELSEKEFAEKAAQLDVLAFIRAEL